MLTLAYKNSRCFKHSPLIFLKMLEVFLKSFITLKTTIQFPLSFIELIFEYEASHLNH